MGCVRFAEVSVGDGGDGDGVEDGGVGAVGVGDVVGGDVVGVVNGVVNVVSAFILSTMPWHTTVALSLVLSDSLKSDK